MKRKIIINTLILSLVAAGSLLFGKGIYIYLKAEAAQFLLKKAWDKTLNGEKDVKPWSWADMHAVAKMIIPGIDEEYIILSNCSGSALAFGPGHLTGSAGPGEKGNCVISAHRDTQFGFLENVKLGDEIILQTSDGTLHKYTITDTMITMQRDVEPLRDTDYPSLTLITCYPFDAIIPGGPLRFIVKAEKCCCYIDRHSM
jgi:sortase A